jgi:hypothetical protein
MCRRFLPPFMADALKLNTLLRSLSLARHRAAKPIFFNFCNTYSHRVAEPRSRVELTGAIVRRQRYPDNSLKLTQKRVLSRRSAEEFGDTQGRASLIILDDLLNKVYSQNVCDKFTKGSHHKNTSVILITHNLFHQGHHCRGISLNVKYLVLLKTPGIKINSHFGQTGVSQI